MDGMGNIHQKNPKDLVVHLIPKHGDLHLMIILLNAFINPAGTCQEAMCLKSKFLSDFCIRALGGGKTNAKTVEERGTDPSVKGLPKRAFGSKCMKDADDVLTNF